MSFVRRVAFRYLQTKRSEAFISILTLISTVALAIGVAVLVVVMSIMNGFEYELKNKLLGANAHITVRAIGGPLYSWKATLDAVGEFPEVESVSPFTYHQGLMQVGDRSTGVLVRGIRPEDAAGRELMSKLTDTATRKVSLFEIPPDRVSDKSSQLPTMVVGKELADTLLVSTGDVITILSPQVQSSPFGLMPRFRRFMISGVYTSGLVEYENTLVYAPLEVSQSFFRLTEAAVNGLEVRLEDLDKAPEVAERISEELKLADQGVYAQPWTETHKNLWEALRLERSAYFVVLLLLVVMASFSVVSTLVMLVLEKRKDIAVLRTMGATQGEVGNIFRITGMTIGIIGTLSGLFLGLLMNQALLTYGFPLPEKIFPVATLPIRMEPMAFVITGACALVICFLATIYPARRASQLKPSELLRYE